MNRNSLQENLGDTARKLTWKIGRKIVYAFLQGSQNYNLDTSRSDLDIKAFCLPSFDDLYDGERFSKTLDYPLGQITIHDLRMLPMLWKKMNPTYLEGFFSCAKWAEMDDDRGKTIFEDLFRSFRSDFLRSIHGTFLKKKEEMHHPTAIRRPVIERYGYDIKSASHALRLGYLFQAILAFAPHECIYDQYAKALRPTGEVRDALLRVKNGVVPEAELFVPLDNFERTMQDSIGVLPKEKIADPASLTELEKAIKTRIKREFNP